MLAGDIYAPRQIRLIDVPEPKLAKSTGQIIVQPELGCLCGSDIPYFEGTYPEFKPQIGHSLHELIGMVVESSGQRFRAGDRVLCVPDTHYGLFERFTVTQDRAIPLDLRAPREHIVLAQPLGTVICALRKMPNLLGANVAVVGQGPIGQLFCAALRNLGASQIIAIEPLASRLKTSPRMGANSIVNSSKCDPVDQVKQLTGGKMADVVIEAVGQRAFAMNLCVDLCRKNGSILAFGVSEQTINNIRWMDLLLKNITVHTSIGPDFELDFTLAMRWIGEGRIDVSPIITHRFELSEIQVAFETFQQRRDGALKVLIEFPT